MSLRVGLSRTGQRSFSEVRRSLHLSLTVFQPLPPTESAVRAKKVFDGILKSKVRADGTRNALTVLQRYRFLFSLPKNIEKNIKNVSF